ncbi:MAG: pyridoxamine 5'-phosphate oxidase family protein [Chloroflexi bacterium]|nr:pyridoxamine 5'-phosphate oxidase family protein [Chloroflexota bacterium]
MGQPSELAVRKQLAALDRHCRTFIAHSPFVLIGTYNASGTCDVSPRGDAPGFVLVLDDNTLVIPERPGNRRLDSLRNILQTAQIGLLFMVPGIEETLRINGRASLVRDTELLERTAAFGKIPLIAIGVAVEECFMQCAKALKRSKLWDPTTWPERTVLPTMAQMMLDHAQPPGKTLQDVEVAIQESYTKRVY